MAPGESHREQQLYDKLASIWGEKLDREEKAIDNWKRVLQFEPEHEHAKWSLLGLFERSERHAEFIEMGLALLPLLAAGSEDDLVLTRKLARCAADELEDAQQAIDLWSRLLENGQADEETLGALEELYASGEEWQDCLRILKLRAEAAQDQYEKIAGWFRVAEIASGY